MLGLLQVIVDRLFEVLERVLCAIDSLSNGIFNPTA